MEIVGVIIAGIIIGLLGKFFAPGDRDNIPLWLTVLCGIGGVLIGYYLAAALGVDETRGIDWIRWIISIVVAAILVVIAATITGRRTGRRISVARRSLWVGVHEAVGGGSSRGDGPRVSRASASTADAGFPASPIGTSASSS